MSGVTAAGDTSPCPPGKGPRVSLRVGRSYGLEDRLCFTPPWGSQGQTDGVGGGQPLTPGMGTLDLGTPCTASWERGSPLLAFFFSAGVCPRIGSSRCCQPASCEHHGEFEQSRSVLPTLSANEEANAWDGCGAGRSEPLESDGPVALPTVPSSAHLSRVLSDVLECKEGLGMRCSMDILCPGWYCRLEK